MGVETGYRIVELIGMMYPVTQSHPHSLLTPNYPVTFHPCWALTREIFWDKKILNSFYFEKKIKKWLTHEIGICILGDVSNYVIVEFL